MKISTNDILTHYQINGSSEGEVVVLSHSLGSSSIMWESQLDALTCDFNVLCYDTRGHGETSAPKDKYSMHMLVGDAVSLLDALEIEKVHWVGLSMGGMIGQGIAINNPDRLHSLCLCNTMSVVREQTGQSWRDRMQAGEELGMDNLVDATMDRWFTDSFRAQAPQAYLDIRAQFLRTAIEGYLGCCHAIYKLDYLASLHQIQVPTHIIAGGQDQATPVAESQIMHERIDGSSFEVIDEAAHLSNVETREAFNRSLIKFLHANRAHSD